MKALPKPAGRRRADPFIPWQPNEYVLPYRDLKWGAFPQAQTMVIVVKLIVQRAQRQARTDQGRPDERKR